MTMHFLKYGATCFVGYLILFLDALILNTTKLPNKILFGLLSFVMEKLIQR